MAGAMYALAWAGAVQIASTVPGVLGMVALGALSRTPLLPAETQPAAVEDAPPAEAADGPDQSPMPLGLALMPYLLLITLSVISQIGPVKEAVSGLKLAVDYPGFTTDQGFVRGP